MRGIRPGLCCRREAGPAGHEVRARRRRPRSRPPLGGVRAPGSPRTTWRRPRARATRGRALARRPPAPAGSLPELVAVSRRSAAALGEAGGPAAPEPRKAPGMGRPRPVPRAAPLRATPTPPLEPYGERETEPELMPVRAPLIWSPLALPIESAPAARKRCRGARAPPSRPDRSRRRPDRLQGRQPVAIAGGARAWRPPSEAVGIPRSAAARRVLDAPPMTGRAAEAAAARRRVGGPHRLAREHWRCGRRWKSWAARSRISAIWERSRDHGRLD
jgi:hypothetical protein